MVGSQTNPVGCAAKGGVADVFAGGSSDKLGGVAERAPSGGVWETQWFGLDDNTGVLAGLTRNGVVVDGRICCQGM